MTLALAGVARTQQPMASGRQMLEQMRAAYARPDCAIGLGCSRWFTTLIFTQTTTTRGSDGTESVATWYESVRSTPEGGTQLRIDTGEPSAGNGVLYTADSVWVFRGGKLVTARPGGNALLPLIEGVYVQPIDRTMAELAPTHVDLSRPTQRGAWNGRAAWIVGASSEADTASPQFWVDSATMAVVRAIFSPVPGAPVMDMRLEKLERVDGGLLATRCEFYVQGKLTQVEEYHNWKAGIELSPSLFSPQTWSTAPHWASHP